MQVGSMACIWLRLLDMCDAQVLRYGMPGLPSTGCAALSLTVLPDACTAPQQRRACAPAAGTARLLHLGTHSSSGLLRLHGFRHSSSHWRLLFVLFASQIISSVLQASADLHGSTAATATTLTSQTNAAGIATAQVAGTIRQVRHCRSATEHMNSSRSLWKMLVCCILDGQFRSFRIHPSICLWTFSLGQDCRAACRA